MFPKTFGKSKEDRSGAEKLAPGWFNPELIWMLFTLSARKERRYWDGEKTVIVVLVGSSVVLPCVNRHPLWREGLLEDQQQVAHWDFQAPGVRPDKADRLVDLYASGERRDYGPLFGQKMSVAEDAFTLGDFSLSISNLKPQDKGLYSCNLHHHYCGLQERRIFRLTVLPALPSSPTTASRILPKEPMPSKPLRISWVFFPRVWMFEHSRKLLYYLPLFFF